MDRGRRGNHGEQTASVEVSDEPLMILQKRQEASEVMALRANERQSRVSARVSSLPWLQSHRAITGDPLTDTEEEDLGVS